MKIYHQITLAILFALFSAFAQATDKNILNIYSWGNYFPNEILMQFTKETGIKVNLSEYDNNETMYAKLKASKYSGYDIVIPSSYYVERMYRQGMLQPLDKSKLTNLHNINPQLLNKKFDPNNNYSIPYTWGSTGIIINTKYIDKKKITSWQNFWDPQYKDQLMMLNDIRDVFGIALITLGYSINDANPKHIEEAYLKLKRLLPNVKIFNIDTVPNIYVDEDAIIGMAWSGDYKLAQVENSELQYIYPKEWFLISIDSFAILKNATNLENAHKFINFMMRPEIAMQACMTTGFTTPNQAAIKLMPINLQHNPILNPDAKTMQRGEIQIDIPEKERRIYEKYWEKLKIGD